MRFPAVELRRIRGGDYDTLASWYTGRGFALPDAEDLPQIGFIVEDLAAGFLFCTDSTIAFADLFVSNPAAAPVLRARAVEAIVERLTEEAKACGFKYVAGACSSPGTKKLCLRRGFSSTGSYELLLKEV